MLLGENPVRPGDGNGRFVGNGRLRDTANFKVNALSRPAVERIDNGSLGGLPRLQLAQRLAHAPDEFGSALAPRLVSVRFKLNHRVFEWLIR